MKGRKPAMTMNSRMRNSLSVVLLTILGLFSVTSAQVPADRRKAGPVVPQFGSSTVIGGGTPGRIGKWAGVSGASTYQLTVVATFAQAIVGSKIKSNRFTVKTNAPNVEVSWQVTGVRSDAAMLKHPFKVEEEKSERGTYLVPEDYGQSEERGVDWVRSRQLMQQRKQQRLAAEQQRTLSNRDNR